MLLLAAVSLWFVLLSLKCYIPYLSQGPCDSECNENGCEGPGPHHCINCLHYFLKFKNNTRSGCIFTPDVGFFSLCRVVQNLTEHFGLIINLHIIIAFMPEVVHKFKIQYQTVKRLVYNKGEILENVTSYMNTVG